MKQKLPNNPIVFFDGECGLCSRSVQFIIKHDPTNLFYFCPLQASIAREIIPEGFLKAETVILYENQQVYTKSSAAFRILKKLKTNWRILLVFSVLPNVFTDLVYTIVAKYRKRLFKTPPTCQLPSPELLKRLL